MKLVIALIRPERFGAVKKALEDKGYIGMTTGEAKGRGAQKGIALVYRSGRLTIDILVKVGIEIVSHDRDVEDLVSTIRESAWTGANGDGRIFVLPVEQAIRIRTGEMEG
jgi:nitrogen regulatory protein P-II 1